MSNTEDRHMDQYGSLREKIAAERAERQGRYAEFEAAYAAAEAAGRAAAAAAMPVPMVVVQRANPLDDTSQIVHQYEPVMDGVCGFAWVTVTPGGSSFARWAVKNRGWRSAYGGGVSHWIGEYNQSMTRKEAHATAMAAVLRERLGVRAYGSSRMD